VDTEAILRDMHANPDEAPVLALAIIEVGATPERISWIESALRAGRLDPAAVMELGRRRSWLSDVNDDDFASLVGVLVEGTAIEQPASALEMMVDRIKDRPSTMTSVLPLLLRALERPAPVLVHGMTDHYWELAATTLIDHGESSRVAELALIALARPRGSNDHAWKTLHQVADRDIRAVWNATSAALDRQGADAEHILMAFRFHRVSFSWPREEVLAWSGHDERRGRTVVSLVRPYESRLDPTLRALVQRFGANSSVAGAIIARIHSSEGITSSLAAHDAEQLKHARGWLTDVDPEIVAFAKRLVESLERSYERHAAYEDDERRRYGT
jgi:hypothetical protein